MKKVENIIDDCKYCKFCQRFNPTKGGSGSAFICELTQRLITVVSSPYHFEFPTWCPLETYSDHSKPATATPMTIVLDSIPHLEWMTENLTGHGGTEVNGRWYYTGEQAMDAAKELGDGWRLPTVDEFQQLCKAGSTWVKNGPDGMPGCWLGGNHDTNHAGSIFLPAAGFRNCSSGALTAVGSNGYYCSSSPYSEARYYAGGLYFGSGRVIRVGNDGRAYGLSVRCVRELK